MKDSVRLSSITVSYGVMESHFPSEVDAEARSLYRRLEEDPNGLIVRLSKLIKKYPDIPTLTNWLLSAHQCAKSDERIIDALKKENYQRFPTYLFARIAYAQVCYDNNEWQRIPEVFDNKWIIEDLHPGRKIFHITEVQAFYHCIGLYYCYAQNYNAAEDHIAILRQCSSESNLLIDLERCFALQILKEGNDLRGKEGRAFKSKALAILGKLMAAGVADVADE